MKNLGNKFAIIILTLLMGVSGAFLFFEERVSSFADLLGVKKAERLIDRSGKTLRIAYLFAPKNLNPYSGDPNTQAFLNDVYEPLVQTDQDLNIRPALAISFGLKSDNLWEITLRNGVKFHDGKLFDTSDVIYSFEQAKKGKDSTLTDLFSNIKNFEKTSDNLIRIETIKPDPLLLNKLTKLLIVEKDFQDFAKPIGTGPYQITQSNDLSNMIYSRNDAYWGLLPFFPNLEIKSMPVKAERIDSLLNGDIDFLANVPPESVQQISDAGIQIATIPSLEVGFVMFNMQDDLLKNLDLRKAIALALNKESFLELAKGHAKTVNQFVSNGVFGYNPDIQGFPYNQKAAADLVSNNVSGFEKLKLKFSYPQNLKILGQYFKDQLSQVGIELHLEPLNDAELQEKLENGELNFYYLGWRSDLGDALPFLKFVIHSKTSESGIYNGNNYDNPEVNSLIEKIEGNMNLQERLKDMQKVMKIVTEDDLIGLPIFETDSLFAFNKSLIFKPRVDSLIYASAISQISKIQ